MDEEYSRYWQTVVETMQDGLIVVSPEGTIVSTNPAMEAITGYSQEELIGRSCDILNCDSCSGVRQAGGRKHCELFNRGNIRRCRCQLTRKDGTVLPVIKNAALLEDESGRVIGGVETLTDLSELTSREMEIISLKRELGVEDSFEGIIGSSLPMRRLYDLIRAAAQSEAPVLILGESGTGKEMVAEAIHRLSPRSKGPMIKVNCAALNESLLESELFGHVKGAFTGANRDRMGRFEAADGGDFFLDEVGDLPASIQVKLLRVLQDRVVERVGDHRPIPVDVRVIAATHRDLTGRVRRGLFREDLYYRVAVIPIQVPPLRERPQDIPLLVHAFVKRVAAKTGRTVGGVSQEAMDLMTRYQWPGNVRELINAVEYALVLCQSGDIRPDHLPPNLQGTPAEAVCQPAVSAPRRIKPPSPEEIQEALRQTGGHKTEAAKLLGISRVTLWKYLKNLTTEAE